MISGKTNYSTKLDTIMIKHLALTLLSEYDKDVIAHTTSSIILYKPTPMTDFIYEHIILCTMPIPSTVLWINSITLRIDEYCLSILSLKLLKNISREELIFYTLCCAYFIVLDSILLSYKDFYKCNSINYWICNIRVVY